MVLHGFWFLVSGKGRRTRQKQKYFCTKCGKTISNKRYQLCLSCVKENRKNGYYLVRRKIATLLDHIPDETLIKDIGNSNWSAFAQKHNVSKTGVRNYCVKRGLTDRILEYKKTR